MMIVKFPLGNPKKCEGVGQSPEGLVVYAFGENRFVEIRVIRGLLLIMPAGHRLKDRR
jgi:hypothetical protein